MPLKRDNWTNAEVMALIEGLKLYSLDSSADEQCVRHNIPLQGVIDHFKEHFACPDDDFGALALDTDSGQVFHVGKIPAD